MQKKVLNRASIKHLLDVNLCLVERQLTIERLFLGELF